MLPINAIMIRTAAGQPTFLRKDSRLGYIKKKVKK